MYVKYICKKDYHPDDLIEINYGEVIKLSVEDKKPKICGIYKGMNELHVLYTIPEEDLAEHFYIYDDIETIDVMTAMWLFRFKFKGLSARDTNNEISFLKHLRYYINAREKFLKSCTRKEDIRSEQDLTTTLHTTNQ